MIVTPFSTAYRRDLVRLFALGLVPSHLDNGILIYWFMASRWDPCHLCELCIRVVALFWWLAAEIVHITDQLF